MKTMTLRQLVIKKQVYEFGLIRLAAPDFIIDML